MPRKWSLNRGDMQVVCVGGKVLIKYGKQESLKDAVIDTLMFREERVLVVVLVGRWKACWDGVCLFVCLFGVCVV